MKNKIKRRENCDLFIYVTKDIKKTWFLFYFVELFFGYFFFFFFFDNKLNTNFSQNIHKNEKKWLNNAYKVTQKKNIKNRIYKMIISSVFVLSGYEYKFYPINQFNHFICLDLLPSLYFMSKIKLYRIPTIPLRSF